MVHLLTSWCIAALRGRGFSKQSAVTCTPYFWNHFSPPYSALKVKTSCFVHALCKSSSGWPGIAGRFPISVSILIPLSFKKVSIFQSCTAASSGDRSYFINYANLWINNVKWFPWNSLKICESLLKQIKFLISKYNDWWEHPKIVDWTKVVNIFLCWYHIKNRTSKNSLPRIWSCQTVEQYIGRDFYCSWWLLHCSFDQIL